MFNLSLINKEPPLTLPLPPLLSNRLQMVFNNLLVDVVVVAVVVDVVVVKLVKVV
jgi:hypothetical protein